MSPLSDRRHFPRLQAPIFYRPARAQLPFTRRRVVDASLGGLRIYSDERLEVGSQLELELFLPDGSSLELTGEVAWLQPLPEGSPARFDVGIAFTRVDDRALARLGAALGPVTVAT